MRSLFVVLGLSIALGACGSRGSQGPAWPKAAEREIDGGESLDPRQATVIAEVKDEKPVVTEAAVKPAEDAAKPADAATPEAATPAATTTITADEDVITVEEIVIEIEEE